MCNITNIQQYVSKWTRKYKEFGLSSLYSKYKGKPSFLSREEKRKIIDFLLGIRDLFFSRITSIH